MGLPIEVEEVRPVTTQKAEFNQRYRETNLVLGAYYWGREIDTKKDGTATEKMILLTACQPECVMP